MKSGTTEAFWEFFDRLPPRVKSQARRAYQTFATNPSHPGLQFKKIHASREIYSVRITRNYRALGILDGGQITWFWIGSHADYAQMLRDSRRRN